MSSQRPRDAFLEGARVMLPILPGVVPFGVTAGIAGIDAGLSPAASLSSSIIIFAGASQLAAMQLIASGALPWVIILTAWVINLRFAMYSASLAPHFSKLPKRWQWPLAYLMTDQAYAVSMIRFGTHPERGNEHWFYMGGAVPMWAVWVASTAVGVALGAQVPASWQLGFAVPLIFMALLVPAIQDKPTALAAVVGGVVAVAAQGLPMNLGLMLGAVAGIAAGLTADRKWAKASTEGEE